MTYDWNKQVEITVPTGTNGWIYSGEVIINGVKVRFPVGVPTTVPEPAAALLNKMIELEREDENNTAKPDNHYVGSVTVPEGKTLTLAKGAKVVDEDGLLGGSSTPAPVVILPETELTAAEVNADGISVYVWGEPSPFENLPAAGNTYKINWGGVDYISTAIDISSQSEAPAGTMLALGNTDLFGGMGVENPAPGAPYLLGLTPTGYDGKHVQMMTNGITPDTPVLSIVEAEGAASGGESAGGGVLMFNVTVNSTNNALESYDKTYEQILAAFNSGKYVAAKVNMNGMTAVMPLSAYLLDEIRFVMYDGTTMIEMGFKSDGTTHFKVKM